MYYIHYVLTFVFSAFKTSTHSSKPIRHDTNEARSQNIYSLPITQLRSSVCEIKSCFHGTCISGESNPGRGRVTKRAGRTESFHLIT